MKRVPAAVIAVAVSLLAIGLRPCGENEREHDPRPGTAAALGTPGAESGTVTTALELQGVSILGVDAGTPASFEAESVSGRQRRGGTGLIVYQDVYDVWVVGARMRTLASGPVSVADLLQDLGGFLEWRDSVVDPDGGGEGPIVARVRFQDLSIRVEYRAGRLSIHAPEATMGFGPRSLVLSGQVAITPPQGERIATGRAVISDSFDGFYLPEGFRIGNKRSREVSYLSFDNLGRLVPSDTQPRIACDDSISRLEKRVLLHLSESVPPALVPLILAASRGMWNGLRRDDCAHSEARPEDLDQDL